MYQHEVFFESASEARLFLEDMLQAGADVDVYSYLLDYDNECHRVILVSEYGNQVATEYLGVEDYDYKEVITTNI